MLNGGNIGIGTDNPSTKLDVRGHITVDSGPVLESYTTGSLLRITTPSGWLSVGAANTSYAHFYTDRAKYYFNKQLVVDEGIFSSYNEDLKLNTSISSTRLTIKSSNGFVGINNTSPASMLDVVGT